MNVALLFGLVAIGMVGQFVKIMSDLEAAGTLMKPLDYVKQRPWRTISAVMGGFMLAWVAFEIGELNKLSAVFIGMACSEAFDSLRARAAGKVRELGLADEKKNAVDAGQEPRRSG